MLLLMIIIWVGLIYCATKPVYWSTSSKTALAEAELEYRDEHVSQACYISFATGIGSFVSNDVDSQWNGLPINLLVWTTTPWTLVANRGIAFSPSIEYVLVQSRERIYIVAGSLRESLASTLEDLVHLAPANDLLTGLFYRDLWHGDVLRPVIPAEFVTDTSGTGLVHLAPAHGFDDYEVCRAHGMEVGESSVDDNGLFFKDIPAELMGKTAMGEGQATIMDQMKRRGHLIASAPYGHKYPYDWRTDQPVMVRATRQWFVNIEACRQNLLSAIETIDFDSGSSRNKLIQMVNSRNDWCISRQRSWGLPLPVFYDTDTGTPLLDANVIEHVAKVFEELGSDAWWQLPIERLLPDQFQAISSRLEKGKDTFDVWFDSGTLWAQDPKTQADLYIEGSDQYRGWFQSSLITSTLARGVPPMKRIISHGFVVDQQGNKMSKSKGNVVAPSSIIQSAKRRQGGTDLLRVLLLSADYRDDIRIGDQAIGIDLVHF